MKYQSEVIKEIIASKGHSKSLPHYESECVETWIEEAKGSYPKITDYKGEWLAYINDNNGIGEFPYVSLTDVTEATIENVVPYAYKRAILKGQTLVNLVGEKHEYVAMPVKTLYGWEFMFPYKLTSGKTYLAIFDVTGTIDESNSKVYLMDNDFDSTTGNTSSTVPSFNLGHNVVKCIATNDKHKVLRIRTTYNENEKFTVSNVMLIEYQEGMENCDIPYFEGMQSVKMPVLTATGKNLYSYGDLTINNPMTNKWYYTNGKTSSFGSSCKRTDGGNWFYLEKGVYSYKSINENVLTNIILIGEGETPYGSGKEIPSGWYVFRFRTKAESVDYAKISQIQLEKGPNITTYEPFKSNILTVNEDDELRGIGEGSNRVEDELDCLTGEVVERIGEIVLNENIDGYRDTNYSVNGYSAFRVTLIANIPNGLRNVICDKVKYYPNINLDWNKQEEFFTVNGNSLFVKILSTKANNFEELRTFLSSSPITIQYPLETESVKTVELSCVDEQGDNEPFKPIEGTMHVSTSSQTFPPLLDMSVPVEATSQNLMSFANIEEEEK